MQLTAIAMFFALLIDAMPSPVRKVGVALLVEPLAQVRAGHFVARHPLGVD